MYWNIAQNVMRGMIMIEPGDIYKRNDFDNAGYGNYLVIVNGVGEQIIVRAWAYTTNDLRHVCDRWDVDEFKERFDKVTYACC